MTEQCPYCKNEIATHIFHISDGVGVKISDAKPIKDPYVLTFHVSEIQDRAKEILKRKLTLAELYNISYGFDCSDIFETFDDLIAELPQHTPVTEVV